MYILAREKTNGRIVCDSPPAVHHDWDLAKVTAETLATVPDTKSIIIFKAYARTSRTMPPVETKLIDHSLILSNNGKGAA